MRFYRYIYYVSFTILTLLFWACMSTNKIGKYVKGKKYYLKWTPPGTIKIENNFFCDETEVTNTDWLEYMYWTQKVFGINSYEYQACMPESSVWIDWDLRKRNISCLMPLAKYYLRSPTYSDYPVVGVSQEQAIAYSKWRSDRVMELILFLNKKIEWDSAPNKDTYFTIERYFTGHYKNIKPDKYFQYYPDYRLPKVIEWKKAVHYTDSINKIICKDSIPIFRSDIDPCTNDTTNIKAPTENVYTGCISKKDSSIYNLRGNVSEWTSEDGISVGGGWADKRQIILTQDTFHVKTTNAWTGFRNVCEWKRWTK